MFRDILQRIPARPGRSPPAPPSGTAAARRGCAAGPRRGQVFSKRAASCRIAGVESQPLQHRRDSARRRSAAVPRRSAPTVSRASPQPGAHRLRRVALQHLQLQAQQQQRLPGFVVQFPADAPPLLFLGAPGLGFEAAHFALTRLRRTPRYRANTSQAGSCSRAGWKRFPTAVRSSLIEFAQELAWPARGVTPQAGETPVRSVRPAGRTRPGCARAMRPPA